MKLNVLIAKAEAGKDVLKSSISNFIAFFKSKQEAFRGIKKTYSPKEGFHDDPSMRSNLKVATTVEEKLNYFEGTNAEHINNLLSQEATNASDTIKTELIVDGISFGILSSLELLRLKDIVDGHLVDFYKDIPVRSDTENWEPSNDPEYAKREVWEAPVLKTTTKTTTITSRILEDPNIANLKDGAKYTPQVVEVKKQEETGDATMQKFSGEISHVERAAMQRRKSNLSIAILAALKEANDAEVVESQMTAEKLFNYLHRGK